MNTVKVLIADGNTSWSASLQSRLEQFAFFEVLDTVDNGEKALQRIEEQRPDVIVLDLVLTVVDGLYVLAYLQNTLPDYHPFVYVVSSLGAQRTGAVLGQFQVDYYSIKPINANVVANNLYVLHMNQKKLREIFPDMSEMHDESTVQEGKSVEEYIDEFLGELGVPPYMKCTTCVAIAVKKVLEVYPNKIKLLQTYQEIGDEMNPPITAAATERNIRHLRHIVRKRNSALFQECFPLYTDERIKMNNHAFLGIIAKCVMKRMQNAEISTTGVYSLVGKSTI